MTTVRRILAATDFSPAADRAVLRAVRLARQHGAQLRLLHVVPEIRRLDLLSRQRRAARSTVVRTAHLALETLAARIRTQHDVDAALSITSGRAHRGILAACKTGRADLVVIGVRGEHDRLLGENVLGGTAAKLLDRVPAALLVVRTPARQDYRLQLVGADLSARTANVVRSACALLPESRVALLTVYGLPYAGRVHAYGFDAHWLDQQIDGMAAGLRQELAAIATAAVPRNRRAGTRLLRGDPRRLLPDHAANLGADCLTLGAAGGPTRGRSPVTTFGDVARAVIPLLSCDVLLVR